MRLARTLAATAVAVAVAAAPVLAASSASAAKPAKKPAFAVTKLVLVGPRTVDVATKDARLKFAVQVKDHDKKFDPKSVAVYVVKKGETTGTKVDARLLGKSKVVSSWAGSITVAKGTEAGTYCLTLVRVADNSTLTGDVFAQAKGLQGRDCYVVK